MVSEVEHFLAENNSASYERDGFDRYVAKKKLTLSCPTIHITGSNGKGSVAHYLESIYLAAGYHVASFIKPAFYEVNECIRFDGANIADADLAKLFRENEKDFHKYGLTSFEATVAMAYRYFESKKPDIAIVEAGMGGAIDATNLDDLNTVLAIVTTVSLEHTYYLGTTESQIAFHKAGIIKPYSKLLIGKMEAETAGIFRQECKKLDSKMYEVDQYHHPHLTDGIFYFDYGKYKELKLNTIAEFQLRNAAIAVEAATLLSESFPVSEEAIRKGLFVTPLPGRVENHGNTFFDGAHNPEGVESLCRCVGSIAKGRPVHVLFASFLDKNIAIELPMLANVVDDITLTTFDHPRARKEEHYLLQAEDHPFVENPLQAYHDLQEKYPEDVILITGSLAFVGYMRKAILG